jgi:hypothetical protein
VCNLAAHPHRVHTEVDHVGWSCDADRWALWYEAQFSDDSDADVSPDSCQNVASGALKGHQEALVSPGGGMVDSHAFQMMSVPEGLLRAVWRARSETRTIAGSPASKGAIQAVELGWRGCLVLRHLGL